MKQEEIREEVAMWQHRFNQDFCFTPWEELTDLDRDMFRAQADALFCRLSPLGVVIKVDIEAEPMGSRVGVCEYFEPLIEESK